MQRPLALTSPLMRGEDVRHLQGVLNERLHHYKSRRHGLALDGIYGRATQQVVRDIAYIEGLHHYDATQAVLELILHPQLRIPAQLHESSVRQKAREEADKHIGGGVTGLDRIVRIAEHYLGVHENPDGSNWGEPFPAGWEKHFGFTSGVSWCGCFAGSMVLLAGGHVDGRVAFCPYIEADAISRTNGFDAWVPNHTEGVRPGWLVLYNWNGGSEPEHVGIVKEIHPDHLVACEGNTGGHGGEVAIESRPYSFTVGFARPRI